MPATMNIHATMNTTPETSLMKILPLLICASLLGSVTMVSSAQAAPGAQAASTDVAARVKALDALLAEQWQHTLQSSPEFATILGDLRYNDRWSDMSLAHAAAERKVDADFLKRFEAIDTTGFSDTDKLNQQLMVRQLKDSLKSYDLKLYEMPLDQMSGVHLALAGFVSSIPFDNTKDYEDYLARLKAVPKGFDQVSAVAQQGMHGQVDAAEVPAGKSGRRSSTASPKPAGMDSVFAEPVRAFPDQSCRGRPEAPARRDSRRDQHRTCARPTASWPRSWPTTMRRTAAPNRASGRCPMATRVYRFAIQQMTTTDSRPSRSTRWAWMKSPASRRR